MMHLSAFGILIVIAAVGTIGNLLIIGAVCIYKRLRVQSHVFIVNLAVADLLVTSYIMPVGLATSQFLKNPFGKTMCDLNAFLVMTSCGVSTQTLMAIALERYFHICRPWRYRKLFTRKLLVFYVIFIWFYTMLWTSQGYTTWTNYKYSDTMYICIFDGTQSISYNVCLATVGIIIPIMVVTICYVVIFRTVRGGRKAIEAHRKRLHSIQSNNNNNSNNKKNTSPSLVTSDVDREHRKNRQEYHFVVTLFAIVIIFGLCWLPATFVLTFSGIWTSMPDILWPLAIWLAFCNSSMNSIAYGVMNKHYRTGYLELIEYVFCCRKCKCATCAMYYASDDDSLNSQSRLAPVYPSPDVGPTFRFPASNQLKGYGARNTSPLYEEIHDKHHNGNANRDILRQRISSSESKSIKSEKLNNNKYYKDISTQHSDYPQRDTSTPEVDYVYGAFTSGNSSIITIESTISEDSEYEGLSNKKNRQSATCQESELQTDSLNHDPYHRHKRESEHIYDVIEHVHRGKVEPPVKTTKFISLQGGGVSPVYEVPIPDGGGEIILPSRVKRTPVFTRKSISVGQTARTEDTVTTKEETRL